MKKTIVGFGFYYFLIGTVILFAPIYFYQNTPGVSMMGPYNAHFVRDVSFAFIASGAALLLGLLYSAKSTVIAGALWPFMHALFHVTIWGARDFVIDLVTISDFLCVIIPGLIVFILAIRFKGASHA